MTNGVSVDWQCTRCLCFSSFSMTNGISAELTVYKMPLLIWGFSRIDSVQGAFAYLLFHYSWGFSRFTVQWNVYNVCFLHDWSGFSRFTVKRVQCMLFTWLVGFQPNLQCTVEQLAIFIYCWRFCRIYSEQLAIFISCWGFSRIYSEHLAIFIYCWGFQLNLQ